MEISKPSTLLSSLEKRKLNSIVFIWDYYQFFFDGPYLTINNPITIINKKSIINKNNVNFNNSLIDLIGKMLINTKYFNKDFLELIFENETIIKITLKPNDYISPEGVIFKDDERGILDIW
jgi:hypothetical protein